MNPDEPNIPGVAPALGASGPCPKITSGQKVWAVGWPTQDAKAELEGLVVESAIANNERLKRFLTPEKYAEKCDRLDKQIDGGHYLTFGTLWNTVNSGRDGTALFLCALLRQHHPNATIADARGLLIGEPRQVRHALARVVPPFFIILTADLPVPEEQKAALLAQGTAMFAAALTDDTPTESVSPTL